MFIYPVLQMLAYSFMVFDSYQLSQYFNEANSDILLRRMRHLLASLVLRTERQRDRGTDGQRGRGTGTARGKEGQTEQIKVYGMRRVAAGLTISTLRASATEQIMSSSQLQSVRLRASTRALLRLERTMNLLCH